MAETIVSAKVKSASRRTKVKSIKPLKLSEIKKISLKRIKTGLSELDNVLGGGPPAGEAGLVPGSVVLVAGEPGIGKSTLLTQVLAKMGGPGLYVAGEESPEQIRIRTERLGLKSDDFFILPETNVETIISTLQHFNNLNIVIIDSIQTMTTDQLTGSAGSIGQVRESAHQLLKIAKAKQVPIFLVGHITKSGAIAGPKVLEHLVDVVLYLEGDKRQDWRILRAHKNHFGPIDEVAVFQMVGQGMVEVKNPSKAFLETSAGQQAPGSAIISVLQGLRPMLVEVQALVVATPLAIPRRISSGVSQRRLQLLCAVLQKQLQLPLYRYDVYLNIAGGLAINEPAADLGICLAIASSLKNKVIPEGTFFVGEVGLLGEIRAVGQIEKRIKEAKKLGLKQAVTPAKYRTINEVINKFFR